MDIRAFFRAYTRSPLGLGSIIAAIAVGIAASLLGLTLALATLIALGSLALFLALALGLGAGQAAAAAELDRESGAKASSRLAEAGIARKRLAAMRLAPGPVAAARDLLVLEAGRFIEDCGRAGTYDPEGVAAIVDAPALVDAWLKEADESAVEKRFDVPDANPFPEAAARTSQVLRDKAALVAARRVAALGGAGLGVADLGDIPGADRMAIEEELK